MKYLIDFKINELKKSFTYIDRTSTPYTEKGDLTNSRFSEFSSKNSQGCELIGMQEIDNDGYEISDKYIKFDKFIYEYNLSEPEVNIVKHVITAALGEIANQSWIDAFKFESNKAYATILLGKLGLLFIKDNQSKYFTPILRYPKGREGNTFWLNAEFEKGEQWAKTVIVTKPDVSDNELEHNGISLLQSTYRKLWETENDKRRREERPLLPETAIKKVNASAFVKSNIIVRETGEKQFFMVYIQGSKYNPIDFARKTCGANIELISYKRIPNTLPTSTKKDKDSKKINYFYFDPNDDPKNQYLLNKYKNDTGQLKIVKTSIDRLKLILYKDNETQKFKYAVLKRPLITKKSYPYKEVEISDPMIKGKEVKSIIELKSGDKLRIPVIDEKNPGRITFNEVTIGKIDSKDNKRISVY